MLVPGAPEVREQTSEARLEDADVAKLRTQRETVAAKLAFVIDELDDIGRDVAKAKIAQLQTRLRALDEVVKNPFLALTGLPLAHRTTVQWSRLGAPRWSNQRLALQTMTAYHHLRKWMSVCTSSLPFSPPSGWFARPFSRARSFARRRVVIERSNPPMT